MEQRDPIHRSGPDECEIGDFFTDAEEYTPAADGQLVWDASNGEVWHFALATMVHTDVGSEDVWQRVENGCESAWSRAALKPFMRRYLTAEEAAEFELEAMKAGNRGS